MKDSRFFYNYTWHVASFAIAAFLASLALVGISNLKVEACAAAVAFNHWLWALPVLIAILVLLFIMLLFAYLDELGRRKATEERYGKFLNGLIAQMPDKVPLTWTRLERQLDDDDLFELGRVYADMDPQRLLNTERAILGSIRYFVGETIIHINLLHSSVRADREHLRGDQWQEALTALKKCRHTCTDIVHSADAAGRYLLPHSQKPLELKMRDVAQTLREMKLAWDAMPNGRKVLGGLVEQAYRSDMAAAVSCIFANLPTLVQNHEKALEAQRVSYDALLDGARESGEHKLAELAHQHRVEHMIGLAMSVAKLWNTFPEKREDEMAALANVRRKLREQRETLVRGLIGLMGMNKLSVRELELILKKIEPEMIAKVTNDWLTSGTLIDPDTLANVHPHGQRIAGFAGLLGPSKKNEDEDDDTSS
jgi:hypothetical protein